MSGRPQGRVRQSRRERSQRSRGRDNSADSVSSTRSERDRETTRNTNGRNTRRRLERRDERTRKPEDKPSERDATRSGNPDKREDKSRRGEKPSTRDGPRDLNRDHGKTLNSLDRHSNAANDSRLSSITKRIIRETDRERRITAARQLEEYFSSPENIQVILKNQENVLVSLEDVMYERNLLANVKDNLVQCLVMFGAMLGYDMKRLFQWIFNKLDSSSSDDIKTLLLTALSKIIQNESSQQCFREVVVNVMSLLENILENVDAPELLDAVLSVIMSIATDYPQAFAGYFRDTVDILVGWHIDISQQPSLTAHMSECLIQLHPYWASDIAFSLTLLGQFLEDMEAYAEELSMLANKQGASDGLPSPYTSLPKLTALVRVLTTVVNGIGDVFSPAQTPAITIPYIEDIIQRVIKSICLSGFKFYYEQLFIVGNDCLRSLCNWLKGYYAGCCDHTAVFIIQQLQYCQTPTYPHVMSILDLVDMVRSKVGTSIPITFIKTLLHPGSQFVKLRLTPDEAILSSLMKIYQGFLGIRDVQLMEATYNITVAELTDQFNQLKQLAKACRGTDSEILSSDPVNDVESSKQQADTADVVSRGGVHQPIMDEGSTRQTSSQPMTDNITGAVNGPIESEGMVSMETLSEPTMGFVTDENKPIIGDVITSNTVNGPITNDTGNQPITDSIDLTVRANHLQSIIIFDLCSLSEIATEKSPIIGLWKLTPTLFDLLTQYISACEWTVAACYPAVQYTILHALYTHCQSNAHFLSSVKDPFTISDQNKKGSLSFVLHLLSKVLISSTSSYDTRKLCLVWLMETLDLVFKSGPEITAAVKEHFNFDILGNSLLPLSFNPCCHFSLEVCECMKILIELKLLSVNCLKRCLQDCTVRLMDVNDTVRECYLSLIKALPADIITSFASRNLLQDRIKMQKTASDSEFKQLTTSCEDVWWVKKNHIVKQPTGTFHSYNFQVIMGFIQHGVLPSKEMQSDWLVRLFHTCNRPNKYTASELTHFNSSQSALWFWSTWETAQFCILSKLRTSLGRAQETFQAIEGSLNQYAKEAKAADQDDQAKPRSKDDNKSSDEDSEPTATFPKAYMSQLRTTLLLQFVENLEKLMYNAYDGCTVGMPSPPKSVRVFFRTNRSTCQEWLSRIRLPAVEVSLRCGSPAIAVWHGMQMLQEMKASGKLKGHEFEQTVLLLCKALCEVKSPQAITGLKAWCAKNTEQEMPWINGIILKAKGWYESAAEAYKTSLRNYMSDTSGTGEDSKTKNTDVLSPTTVELLVSEVANCYVKLSDWDEVEKWQTEISSSRKNIKETDLQHAMQLNLDMNYIRALSKFEEGNFTATQSHLRLIPGNCLNAIADNAKKSSWSLHTQETEMTFNPLWDVGKIQRAAEICLVQAGVLYSASTSTGSKNVPKDAKLIKAVKECINQSSSLTTGALQVGCLDWPPLVSPQNILQVQQAAVMEDAVDALTKGDLVQSILQGDGSFTADPTRHNCAVLNQALHFTSHISHLNTSLGKPNASLNSELLTLRLETAMLARKHENYSLAQRLLLNQLVKLGIAVQLEEEPNGQNNILGSLVRGLISVSNVKGSSRLDLLKAQRESAKLAYALGHTQDAVGILSGSVLEFTKINESDGVVRELNSRSLVTLSKWLMNDRKLLTSATKTNSNVTPLVAKMSSLCDTEEEFLGYGHSTLIGSQDEKEAKDLTLDDEMVWSSSGVSSVGSGVDDVESACGQILHLSTMQTPDLGKAWYHLAAWCYRWGRKTVEQASSMGNVELLLEEKDRALQSIPKSASEEEIDAVLSELGQAHSADSQPHDEDIGDDDQFYDNSMDITRKLLLQACPSLHGADPGSLETLLSIWKGVRDRLFKHYHYAAKAYFMYLKIGKGHATNEPSNTGRNRKINKSNDDGNVTATLRLLRLLVKHAGELRSVLEEGLAHTPTRPWKDIIPQLFSRLNHPEAYVRQSVSELLCRVASDAPHLIVYPAVVGSTSSVPQFLSKNKESEGLLPLLVANIQDKSTSQNGSQSVSMETTDQPVKQESDSSMESCYRTIVDSLQSVNPKLVSELRQFIQELRRITLLWEELWLGSLVQNHQEVLRRQQQLDEEIKRVNNNTTLNEQQKMTLIKEKHIAIMKPVVFALEQLQKITNHPPVTPHEQWFHRMYSNLIDNALQVLRNPDKPSDPKASWEPFKQLIQTLQARSQKKSAYSLVMSAISPVLVKMKNTAIYMPGQTHFGGEIVTISSISNEINILPTKTKPKKLVFIGSDGQRHTYLFKGLEDLHLDERIMQFLSICNNMFTRADSHRCPLFYARHYSVTPLGPRSGLIQWVDGAVPLFALYKRWQQREAATMALLKSTQGNNPTPQPPMKPSELFYSKMTPALKEKGIKDPKESDRKEWPLSVMRTVLEELVRETPNDLLARELWCSSTGSLEWWHMTKTYARSTAVMSMIGYIIGLGDRHLDNMLIDFTTGEVVHIDYNVCFEKGKGLRVPEKVPFRMTPNLETALGVTGVEGMFRLSCEQVLKILRQGRETLLTLLEAFVYDPLVDWTSANDNAFASAFYGGGTTAMNDNKVNKKEMERGVTQSLFSSRVAEMKVNWTTNRDDLLTAISAQEELVTSYTASVKHLKSMDMMLDQLKEQQQTLQSAVNNTNHPLHSLQAKFDEHIKMKSNQDVILQSIKAKLGECVNWHSQHKASMEMIHSPQFSVLVADILKPLDIGVPCFAPAIKFLKGAGQGNIVSQCEQLESELGSLLHQRRAMQRTCLDLIHTYGTVTSQFPSNYVNHNRMYEWMCWLQEIVQDSSTKMCQDVLTKSEETRAQSEKTADNPLSVVAMNSLMSLEVKLQTNLTDQNSKFIKFCERRKQESVETGFLCKAVDDALASLNKYVSDNQPSATICLSSVIVKVLCSQSKRCLVMENTAKVAGDRLSDLTSREGDWFLEELCSMSGNVTQLLSLLRGHPLVIEEQKSLSKEELNNSIKGIFAVHKVFSALQELMTNFRNIIVPEAIKSFTSGDPSVTHMLESLERLVHGEDITALAKTVETEMNGTHECQGVNSSSISSKISILQQQFDAIQQSRNAIGKKSSEQMSAGQMLLAGFNGLFTKVESELDLMNAILAQMNSSFGNKTCDVVQEAKKLQESNRSGNSKLCSKLFFLKRLAVMAAFFKDCKELVENTKEAPEPKARERVAEDQPQYNWIADKCYSEDELALHIRQFIAESVQKRILGLPSQAIGIIVYEYLNLLEDGTDSGDSSRVHSIEETCKKVIDIKIKKGSFQQKQFSQMSSLTSAYDVAWRKHDFARRLDHNISLYKGVVQRSQLQLARFQWLYEDDLLRCPLRGNSMISPAKASIMNDMRKRVQSLLQLEPAVKATEDKIITQQSSIEQRLKWAAGANPALNPVLKEFDKTVNDRKKLLQLEAKHSSDICSLSNALIHFEMLSSQSHEVTALDSTITALVSKCKNSSSELEKSLVKLKAVSEMTSLLNLKCPPEAPITLGWMKTNLESVSQEISSHKSRKIQAISSVTTKRESLKSHTNALKALIVTHQQLVSEVKALLTTMVKDEDGHESSTAAKSFITSYNRLSDECAQLIKSTLSCCSGKVDSSDSTDDKEFDDNIQQVKAIITSITSLIHWVHDHLLALASPLMPEDSGSNGGKTPIAAPPPTFASALQKGSTTMTKDIPETSSSYCPPTNPVILHKDHGVQSPSGGGSPTTRPATVASPRKSSSTFLARDPKTGKALQQRNTYAISVWRKVKAKLDGRDADQAKRMSVTDQVDHVIHEATSLDNLSQMYEGWTAWV